VSYTSSKLFELALCERYSREWKEPAFLSVGRFSQFDFCSQSKKNSVEVKVDSTAVRTGNLAIEYWNTSLNEPSGILSTKANLWLHCVDFGKDIQCFEFNVCDVRKCAIELGLIKEIENSRFKIIPIEQLKKYVRREFKIVVENSLVSGES
jgi:hypothetical protein